jgi:hypothetical protein
MPRPGAGGNLSRDLRDTVDRKRARLMLTGVFQHLLALEFVY